MGQGQVGRGRGAGKLTEHLSRSWWEGRSWMIAMLQPGYLPALYHLAREQRQQRQLLGLLVLCIGFPEGAKRKVYRIQSRDTTAPQSFSH